MPACAQWAADAGQHASAWSGNANQRGGHAAGRVDDQEAVETFVSDLEGLEGLVAAAVTQYQGSG